MIHDRRPRLGLERLEDRDQPSAVYAIDAAGTGLLRFDTATPGVTTAIPIAIAGGFTLRGIDFRPSTGQLYGLVTNGTDARVGTINPSAGSFAIVGGTITIAGTNFGVDFNPLADHLRVVSDTGMNLAINATDGSVSAQSGLNPGGPNVVASAYDRNYAIPGATTLFGIDSTIDRLVRQGSVNGSPSNPSSGFITEIGTGLGIGNFSTNAGFDIRSDGAAFATLTVGGVSGLYSINLTAGTATLIGTIGAGATVVRGMAVAPLSRIVVGAGPGGAPHVKVYDGDTGQLLQSFLAFGAGFHGGVRVASGDVNRDGVPDLIAGAGPGGAPHVRVFDGKTGTAIAGFFPYALAFEGGVNVACGDLNGDGFDDIITGTGAGGAPHVRAFSGADFSSLASFFAYSKSFAGGVHVAAADLDLIGGGGTPFEAEIVTAAGPGGGPHVRIFTSDGVPAPDFTGLTNSFFAFAPGFTGGVTIATGDVDGNGRLDIVAGQATGGSAVRTFRGTDAVLLSSFTAYESEFKGSVRVAATDANGDGRIEIVTGPGGGRGPQVRAFHYFGSKLESFNAFDPTFLGGVFVGGNRG